MKIYSLDLIVNVKGVDGHLSLYKYNVKQILHVVKKKIDVLGIFYVNANP